MRPRDNLCGEPLAGRARTDDPSSAATAAAGERHRMAEEAELQYARAEAWLEQGDAQRALQAYERAIDCAPHFAPAHLGEARAYFRLDRLEDAADSLEVVLALAPDLPDALVLLARIRRRLGAVEEALDLLQKAQALAATRADVFVELGLAHQRLQRTELASEAYRTAIALAPTDAVARINLGLIHLNQRGEPQAAEAEFRAILAQSPDHLEALANLGLALHDQGRIEEALDVYRQGLRRHPESVELRWNRGLAELARGNYAAGWEDYALRFVRRGGRNLSRFAYPEWDGSPLPEGRLLVLAEQGLGDEIMFSSCIPGLGDLAPGIVLECAPRLERLFARSFLGLAVHGRERHASLEWLESYSDIAAKVPIGSLPRYLRRDAGEFPGHAGYLRADPGRIRFYRDALAADGTTINVGISWRGGTYSTRSGLRSIACASIRPLTSIGGVRFVSLQHGLTDQERDQARRDGVLLLDQVLADADELAALMSALNLIVTVDNFNLHLAGSMGLPVWGLLGPGPDWRWQLAGARTPWYPSVLLFRASSSGGWDALLDQLGQRLRACAGGRGASSGFNYHRGEHDI